MTRETKVGLLIGLGLILFIGIIVSDHLSQGSQPEAGALTQAADRAQRSISAVPGRDAPIEVQEQTTGLQRQRPDQYPSQYPSQYPNQYPNQRQRSIPTPQEVDQLARPAEGMFGRDLPMVTAVDGQRADGLTNQRQTPEQDVQRQAPIVDRTPPQPRRGAQIIHYVKDGESVWALAQKYLGDGRKWTLIRDHNPNAISSKGILATNARLVIPNELPFGDQYDGGAIGEIIAMGRTKRITVKSGDTLSVLAQRHLGSSRLWPKLLAANGNLIDRPEDLREGMSILIPALTTTPTRNRDAAPPTVRPVVSGRTYTVQAGDNLTRIAAKKLNDASRWDEIYQANQDRLKNPDDLRVGQELRIPSG